MSIDTNIKITNNLSISLSIVTVPFVFVFYLLSLSISVLTGLLAFGYLLTLFLSKRGFYDLSRFNIIVLVNMALVFYGSILGVGSNVIYIFYPFFSAPFILFNYNEKIKIAVSTVITFVSIMSLKIIYHKSFVQSINIPSPYTIFISGSIFLASIILSLIYLYFYIKKTQYYEAQLKKAHKSELSSIQKTMVSVAHYVNNLLVRVVTNAQLICRQSEDENIKSQAAQISDSGHQISKVIRKISKLKDVKEVAYSDGVTMIDLENSTYNN
jgi:hypothetical protein